MNLRKSEHSMINMPLIDDKPQQPQDGCGGESNLTLFGSQ